MGTGMCVHACSLSTEGMHVLPKDPFKAKYNVQKPLLLKGIGIEQTPT